LLIKSFFLIAALEDYTTTRLWPWATTAIWN